MTRALPVEPHPNGAFMRLSTTLSILAFGMTSMVFADDQAGNPLGSRPVKTTASEETIGTHSWELPALTVSGQGSGLREEDLVGTYGQPRWTARRLFTETRIYVIPEGQFQFEYWVQVKDRKDDEPTQVKQIYEVEIGLPYRFQLDLYQVYAKEGDNGPKALDETKAELRWALADWDVIPLNPTLYAEWVSVSGGYDHAEFKLLLGGEIATKWHWGTNFVYEAEVGGEQEHVYEMTNGIMYTLQDERFGVGLEAKFAYADVDADRGNYEKEIIVGPSLQFRPLPQMHIDAAHLFGCSEESPESKTSIIVGWEF
jgi:hypothetical protein